MKKVILSLGILLTLLLTSCSSGKSATEVKNSLQNQNIDRISITNTRHEGRYTITDAKSIQRFTGYIEKAKVAKEDTGLEPDFVFEIYNPEKSVGTYKYIAGVTDKDEANLIGLNGEKYRISRNIEDIFIKRLMKKDNLENVPEYYTSLINTIIEKQGIKEGSKVVADIGKDHAVTRFITSVEQESILDSVKSNGIKVSFPKEGEAFDYKIEIKTGKYSNTTCEAQVEVKTPKETVNKYEVSGNYKKGNWEFHITYKK